jgi:TolB-like protein
MSFFEELKRRNVFRVGIAYVVSAWVLLQVVDLVLDNIAAPEWVMKVFMLAVGVGLPLALILAWAFEMTPEGLKRETTVNPEQSITPQTGRKLDRIIIVSLGVAVAFLLVDRFISEPGDVEPTADTTTESVQVEPDGGTPIHVISDKSIAVLPLANRSVRPEDAFFAEGMHDELLTQLSRISALRVISRTSVMGYAGTTKRMPDIGRELGVSTLLEGGVQRSGNRVRINVQLIEAATDEHLWAEVYDRELTADNLFEIQSDITLAIASALQAVLTGQEQQVLEQKPTENLDAYAHYLRGKVAASTYGRTPTQIEASIASYRSAIELDPKFAAAYAALSIDLIEHFWVNGRVGDLGPATQALEKARELAPEAAGTQIAEGYYHYWGHLNYERAIDAFDRALESSPGELLAIRGRAYALRRMGRFEDSLEDFNRILSLDPLNGPAAVEMAYSLTQVGRFDEAFAKIEQARALGTKHSFFVYVEAYLMAVEQRLDEARAVLGTVSESMAPIAFDLSFSIARWSRDNEFIEQMEELAERRELQNPDGVETFLPWRARVLWDRGQYAEMQPFLDESEPNLLKLLDTSPDQAAPLIGLIELYSLRGDRPRFDAMVHRYDHDLKPDALRLVEQGMLIPIGYARFGDADAALDRIDLAVEQFGIWEFSRFSMDPVFDSMRDNPRFQALDKRLQQWLESRKK